MPESRSGSPVYFILRELRKVSPEGKVPRSFPALDMVGVFDEWTQERKDAYNKDLIAAIRAENINQLRTWHNEGRTLQAANSFGESILHMACRRGFLDVVKFLVQEAHVNLWIRDDAGRTPLHDACWTPKPCFALVDFIVNIDRDMLFVSDKRGHTPLDYSRKDSWSAWVDHFQKKDVQDLLPRRECFFTDKSLLLTHEEIASQAILENVDDMICQLEISRSTRRKTRSRKGGDDEERRRRRRHRRRQRHHLDVDHPDDGSIGSKSQRSLRTYASHRSTRSQRTSRSHEKRIEKKSHA